MTVIDFLDISAESIVAVIGCGGKTSLIELLADKLGDKRVLISPTTKMFPLKTHECLGVPNVTSGKLESLSEQALAEHIPRYEFTLLEADGSGGLPCKGWLDNEPVIPRNCTHTVGVVTLSALGSPATKDIIHRLPEFLSLTGLREGAIVTEQALIAMVCSAKGMFKNSVGRRYLLVNRAENEAAMNSAQSFLQAIKETYPNRFQRLLYGSVHLDSFKEV